MKKLKLTVTGFWIICISILFVGCATTSSSIITDYDRDADFSQYRTYFWSDEFQMQNGREEEKEPLFYNTLVKKRLKQAIRKEMEGRGYVLSNEDPDLLVNAQVVVQERNATQTYSAYPYYSYYYGPYYNRDVTSDKQGDIVIDLIDQDQHQLVWQGYAKGVLDTNTKDRQEEIRKAVSLIFAEYEHRAGEGRTESTNR
jgi:hypothetical protein